MTSTVQTTSVLTNLTVFQHLDASSDSVKPVYILMLSVKSDDKLLCCWVKFKKQAKTSSGWVKFQKQVKTSSGDPKVRCDYGVLEKKIRTIYRGFINGIGHIPVNYSLYVEVHEGSFLARWKNCLKFVFSEQSREASQFLKPALNCSHRQEASTRSIFLTSAYDGDWPVLCFASISSR